ncbi:aminoglycoside phosphotransferase family protein [Kineococcus sp. R86509]|uniref:aminoglycoside phosphotransferase family protein n=1 Tax=Kineococcus sp. R86509 TaxID=3093851 RepID=UPI0036D3A839
MTSTDAATLASEVLDKAVPARPISSGGDHRSWWIGKHHVLRWTPDPSTSQRLQREIALRRWLPQHLHAPVPTAVADGTWHGHRWVLDERLPGHDLDEGPFTARTHTDLVQLLSDLAHCAVTDVTAMGVPTRSLPDLPQLLEAGLAAHRALGIERPLTPPATTDVSGHGGKHAPVLVHADVKSEHLLVDATGQLSGVLDWSDAAVGEVSLDVEGLVITVGAQKATQIAHQADIPATALKRGVLLARCHTAMRLDALLNRAEPSGPELLLRRQHDLAWN